MNIGASIVTYNVLSQDYCISATLSSLFDCVDEIIVVDVGSTDGTLEYLNAIAKRNQILTVVQEKLILSSNESEGWKTGENWLCAASNLARERLRSPYHLAIQADEVLHELEIPAIRACAASGKAYRVPLAEFWRDSLHCFQHNHVLKLAPTNVPYLSDAGTLDYIDVGKENYVATGIAWYHYGFIRDLSKWIRKGIWLLGSLHHYEEKDTTFFKAIERGVDFIWNVRNGESLKEFRAEHPKYIKPWLLDHGHALRWPSG